MADIVKKTGHLSNCFFFNGFIGFVGLFCYYYWTKTISKLVFAFFASIVVLYLIIVLLLFGLQYAVTAFFGYLVLVILGGLFGMVIGAIVGEPDWRKIIKINVYKV